MQAIAESRSQLGESPFWHSEQQALYWCDIPGHAIRRLDRSGAVTSWPTPAEPGCIAPTQDSVLIVARRDGVFRFDPQSQQFSRLVAPPYEPTQFRFNDGRCDPSGRLLVGTLVDNKSAPDGKLYALEYQNQQWHLIERAAGVTTANGLAFSPDNRTAYWSDTAAHRIDQFDFNLGSGVLSNRRVFMQFEPKPPSGTLENYLGRPDGAAVDQNGDYWVAMYEGGRVLRITPNGDIRDDYPVPAQCPTMVCFGGEHHRTLFVTTARANRPKEELNRHPNAGCVFRLDVDVPGLPTNLFNNQSP